MELSSKGRLFINGQQLEAIRLEMTYEEHTCGVEVVGIPDDMTESQIRSFFQRLIGTDGGKIEEALMDKANKRAVLTMETIEGKRR